MLNGKIWANFQRNIELFTSVADPHIFRPLGSGSTSQRYGSRSFYHHANIDSCYFVTPLDFLSLKNVVKVAS
jgi:hypothetical protein